MAYVYILKCSDGSYYTGFTTDIERRLSEHNQGIGSKYTRSRLPVECVYLEELFSKSEAMKQEIAIKKMSRKEKEAFINENHKSLYSNNMKVKVRDLKEEPSHRKSK